MIRRRIQTRLDVTPEMAARIRDVRDALQLHIPGLESSAAIDIPKIRLADVVLAQVARQTKLPTKARAVKATLPAPRRSRRRA